MNSVNKSIQKVTWQGKPLHLKGRELHEGERVPDFLLVGPDLNDVTLDKFNKKFLVISVVPSLDTSTCALQTKRFNEEAKRLSDTVAILTVSLDLPFAQTRWCGAEKCEQIITASDYKYRSFGEDFGVYIQDLGLLARAVFVINQERKIVHVEYVENLSAEPNYAAVLSAVRGWFPQAEDEVEHAVGI